MTTANKIKLTFNELKKLLKESISSIEDTPGFDISKAIESKNYKIEGRWETSGEPYPGNARIFALCLYQQTGEANEWLHLCFNVFTSCDVSYFKADKKIEDVWKIRNANRLRNFIPDLIEVTEDFKNEILNNEALRKLIEEYVLFNCQNESEENADKTLARQMGMFDKLTVKYNNDAVERRNREKEKAAAEEQIRKYANGQQEKLGRKYSYYKEYYRGEYGQIRDDDYEGSGETTLGSIAVAVGCKTPEDVDKLIEKLQNGPVSTVEGNYRVIYNEKRR